MKRQRLALAAFAAAFSIAIPAAAPPTTRPCPAALAAARPLASASTWPATRSNPVFASAHS